MLHSESKWKLRQEHASVPPSCNRHSFYQNSKSLGDLPHLHSFRNIHIRSPSDIPAERMGWGDRTSDTKKRTELFVLLIGLLSCSQQINVPATFLSPPCPALLFCGSFFSGRLILIVLPLLLPRKPESLSLSSVE